MAKRALALRTSVFVGAACALEKSTRASFADDLSVWNKPMDSPVFHSFLSCDSLSTAGLFPTIFLHISRVQLRHDTRLTTIPNLAEIILAFESQHDCCGGWLSFACDSGFARLFPRSRTLKRKI
ncbi:hypothetical protein AUEXF2481DRAFT_117258 [Aureobasidium subglaciale EXF-2481]|uniref:Uncharacterized protein n=1 Tax=Aureobasidium subglaciale (strain EXF-2481) TaxID=1043005 RepID=A0A074ZP58_AURSE|nr:uncharacterized protein AUEXF2481DRAFT_117258 [Aureobasidium subglaciale EXF-2481]KER00102.1 hypothetical protein AUEXF2481DRAFT_117258 [Aureobasidium subglaciale EXF-2481]